VRDLAALTAADFEAVAGTAFEIVRSDSDSVEIVLEEVVVYRERPGHRQPFALQFRGPPVPILEHVTHRVVHAEMGDLDLFLGPIASDADGTIYEAVFT
jgi:hypothetical protein